MGSAVAYDGHAQHSAYVVRNGGLRGLTAEEIEIVALVARYHGAARPRKRRDEAYAGLRRKRRRTVRWLAAMLRVAEGFDRSHYQLVRGVSVRRRAGKLFLVADAKRQAQLEIWAGRRRATDLERLLGMPVGVATAIGDQASTPARRRAVSPSATGVRGSRRPNGRPAPQRMWH